MDFAGVDFMKFLVAMVFVLGLIWGFALVAKHFGLGNREPVKRSRSKRLSIIETMALDAKRRVVIVRHDDTEHLLLLGNSGEQVIRSADNPADAPAKPRPQLQAIEAPWEAAG